MGWRGRGCWLDDGVDVGGGGGGSGGGGDGGGGLVNIGCCEVCMFGDRSFNGKRA